MFGELIGIVDLIRSGIESYGSNKAKGRHEKVILGVLRAYFLFKDSVDDGETLLLDAAPDPVAKLNSMDEADAIATLQRWNAVLDKQNVRLQALQSAVSGQHHLEVLNPVLQTQIENIIGNKMSDTQNLYKLGAALVFRNMFPGFKTREETPNYVLTMAGTGTTSEVIDLNKVENDIAQLRTALDKYRDVVKSLVTSEELTKLSERARRETLIQAN